MLGNAYCDLAKSLQNLFTHSSNCCPSNSHQHSHHGKVDKNKIFGTECEHDKIELKSLRYLRILGSGTFGEVHLVQSRKNSKEKYALKRIKKSFVIAKNTVQQIFNEKTIQYACNSIFVVKLYKTFQDETYLYFLLENCIGGDLWTLSRRQKKKCFTSKKARFISACILEALIYIHNKDFAFLDLKPENILINHRGYVKLSDFGNAIYLPNGEKSYIYAGTCEYMAPEIYSSLGHDKRADYWAFGVLIYELLIGRTPFVARTESKMQNLVLAGLQSNSDTFPKTFPKRPRSLIESLLCQHPNERLEPTKIVQHPWYEDFEWAKLRAGQMKSPIAYRPPK